MAKAHGVPAKVDAIKLSEEGAKKVMNAAIGLAVVGVVLGAAGYFTDAHRFAFSYLTGFLWLTTIALGGLFFVIIQHLTKAGWSVAPRRHMEWISGALPACAALFLPIVLFAHDIWHHWMGPEAAHDEILQKKAGYLNPSFFYIRAAIYFAIWIGLALWFAARSAEQDETGNQKLTVKMQNMAPPAVLLFGLSITFAGFDWLMSLDPHWYSTIFGVYVFAGAAVSSLSVLALVNIKLQQEGLLQKVSNVEHRHDIGKLLFGFIVFWAYIGFSQFILIWYANIPEETLFYKHRWEGSWKVVSMTLLIGHFVLPFLVLLSRHAKRHFTVLAGASVWMLVMHYVDLYWLVMPTLDHHGAHFSWIDLAGLLAPVGVGALLIALRATRGHLYPLKDPRLAEAAAVENL
ncbi:hypothetical protein [Chondromyces crocatus]|uniref:Quinol:cytochrome C oxidoreductase n=1 Tax=Chondromyces crocatus TaxID=52 RepID=A0A0K1ETH0_CHOCO|nr:hypothetical protein [Chondromyces crocatus]AKT43933.1 uncharacterized protein CMC5_081700 [Chondromyces crocatus]